MKRTAVALALAVGLASLACSSGPSDDTVRTTARKATYVLGLAVPDLSDSEDRCLIDGVKSAKVELDEVTPTYPTRLVVVEALQRCAPGKLEDWMRRDFLATTAMSDPEARCVAAEFAKRPDWLASGITIERGPVDPDELDGAVEALTELWALCFVAADA